jgi:nucleotide-binding universal stress UspA family protein
MLRPYCNEAPMKRILVGLDGPPRAPGVLASATTIARARTARLTGVTAARVVNHATCSVAVVREPVAPGSAR